jgi:hypothetical protein
MYTDGPFLPWFRHNGNPQSIPIERPKYTDSKQKYTDETTKSIPMGEASGDTQPASLPASRPASPQTGLAQLSLA